MTALAHRAEVTRARCREAREAMGQAKREAEEAGARVDFDAWLAIHAALMAAETLAEALRAEGEGEGGGEP